MKFAVITDIHANREALEAVLAHARGHEVQRHAFLGDLVGYGADPGWVVDCVREHAARGDVVVQGNHDAAVVSGAGLTMRAEVLHVIDWTRAQLNPVQINFLATLPLVQETGEVLFVHANAYQPSAWGYIEGRAEAARSMRATRRRITFCGHMHEPRLYHLTTHGNAGEFVPPPGTVIPLLAPRRWLVIPGAAGQPRDGDPAASYAVFDDERVEITCWRVPYDHERASAKVSAAGLPEALATRLIDGH